MPVPPRRPDPPPLETDDRRIALAGTIAWTVALIVLAVFFLDDLRRHAATWWLWTCGVGIALGLYGFRYVSRRRR